MELPETDSEDEIPPGWEERSTADGSVFYANHESKSTQWTHPRTGKRKRVTGDLPYGWIRNVAEDGKVVFVNHINNKTTYTDPRLAFAVEETNNINELRQRFDSCSTGFQVAHGRDLTGHVAIVTGSSGGIGFETVRTLVFHGCHVILACRNMKKAEKCISQLKQERPNCQCEGMHLELESLRNVNIFVRNFASRFKQLDLLILNAGVFGLPFTTTQDGFESTFQINFLSQFYLALLLQPCMTKRESDTSLARVIFVSAEAHRFSNLSQKINLIDQLSPPQTHYLPTLSYNNSKLCCIVGAFEIHRRFADLGLKCYAVHPGNMVYTGLSRHWWLYRLLFAFVRPFAKSLQQACAPIIYCAISPDMANCSGIYINNCVPCMPSKEVFDPVLGNKLWVASLKSIENVIGKKAFDIHSYHMQKLLPNMLTSVIGVTEVIL